jgi:hypothetical protein
VESKWKNYHIITFPGQSLSKTLEEAMDLSQDRLILELELTMWALSWKPLTNSFIETKESSLSVPQS